jgi:hypothetical protein
MYLNKKEALELSKEQDAIIEFKIGDVTGYIGNGILTQWQNDKFIGKVKQKEVSITKLPKEGYTQVDHQFIHDDVLKNHKINEGNQGFSIFKSQPTTVIKLKKTGEVKRRFNILMNQKMYEKLMYSAVTNGLTRNQMILQTMYKELS